MRRVRIVVLSVALTLLSAPLAAAKPKPVAFDDALVNAVRDGWLAPVSEQLLSPRTTGRVSQKG